MEISPKFHLKWKKLINCQAEVLFLKPLNLVYNEQFRVSNDKLFIRMSCPLILHFNDDSVSLTVSQKFAIFQKNIHKTKEK